MSLGKIIQNADKSVRDFARGNIILSVLVSLGLLWMYIVVGLKLLVSPLFWAVLLWGVVVFYLVFHAIKIVVDDFIMKK